MQDYLPPISPAGWRWLRFAGLLFAAAALVWLCQALSGVLTLLAVALALAYICNPLVTALQRRGVSRLATIIGLYAIGFVLVAFGAALLGTAAAAQWTALADRAPDYAAGIHQWLVRNYPQFLPADPDDPNAPAPMPHWLPEQAPRAWLSVAWLGQAFSGAGSLLSALVLVPMFAFFFLWQWEQMLATIRAHLPAAWRPTIVHIVSLVDEKTADFFRGRLIACALVGLLTGIGWQLAGVPYSLPLGAAVGVLNLVPFLPMIALPPAVLLTYADASGSYVMPVGLLLLVFLAVQALESFVLYPWLSARSSGLHPVTTIVALLIGAELAGLLGMLLSIPVASTLKALGTEYVLPELRRLAAQEDPQPPPPDESP